MRRIAVFGPFACSMALMGVGTARMVHASRPPATLASELRSARIVSARVATTINGDVVVILATDKGRLSVAMPSHITTPADEVRVTTADFVDVLQGEGSSPEVLRALTDRLMEAQRERRLWPESEEPAGKLIARLQAVTSVSASAR